MSKRPKDPEAFERKVKPIYDALDSRNWKGALKLCQQALQKYPDNELIKVLKAIGLERSGKREEANQVVDEVIAVIPTDEQVLRLSSMVLRSSGRLPDITRMYEAAAAAVATRGGELALVLQHEVFGAHVREQNYVKQQQVAMRLSKAAAAAGGWSMAAAGGGGAGGGGERYGWWVVLSIMLQVRAALRARATGVAAPAGQVPLMAMEPEMMLALAEGMMARQAAKDGRLEGYEALMVYVDVLLAQGKTLEALNLVSGPLGASALRLPAERLQLRAVLSALCGDLKAASELLREGLALNPDDWGALLLLLDCMLPGTAASVSTHGLVDIGRTGGGSKRPKPSQTSSSSSTITTSTAVGSATTTAAAATTVTTAAAAVSSAAAASEPSAAAASFRPQHPLILISGGLAEQQPPRGVPVPPGEGYSPEAFSQAEAVLRELVEMGGQVSTVCSGAGGCGGGDGCKAMIMRGPDLALVDLASRRHLVAAAAVADGDGDNDDTEAAVVDAVLSYYRKYGGLVSCAVDLRTYVAQLGTEAAGRLAEALEADAATTTAAAEAAPGATAPLVSLRRRVCAAQIRDDLGLPRLRSCKDGVDVSKELLDLYGTAQPLQAGLDERERGAADELPVLAAAALATSAGLAQSDAAAVPYMLAAYGALADAVRVRPYSAGMRISLAAIATLLAAPSAAAAHMYKLDVKHVQMDTLAAHQLLPPLLTWPHSAAATGAMSELSGSMADVPGHSSEHQHHQQLHRALRDTQALFDDHARDAGESLFTAYGHGMYTKVLEFTAFRERLAAAHTLAVVRAESGLLDCLKGSGGGSSSSSNSNGTSCGSSSSVGGGGLTAAAAAALAAAGPEVLVAVDAMRAAAVAAAGRLNLDDLPTADTLRFNWDLSTRPTWLPPCAAGPSATVVEWWRCRARGEIRGQGYGRCWWSATGSAESPSLAAAQWRKSQASAAAHRWLLPHCIAGALGATAPGVLGLREAVARLTAGLMSEQTQGCGSGMLPPPPPPPPPPASSSSSPATAMAAAVGEAPTEARTTVGADDLRRLDVTLYGAALAVEECFGTRATATAAAAAGPLTGADPAEATAAAACAALGELTAAVRGLVALAAAGLAAAAREAVAWGGVLPGGPLAAVSLLVREHMPVAMCCVQSWQATLKALRKRKAKAGSGATTGAGAGPGAQEGVISAQQRLSDAVSAAAGELAAAARACAEALTGALTTAEGGAPASPAAAAAELAVLFLKAQGHATPAVSDSATSALEALIREQRLTVGSIARQAAMIAAALS